MDLGSKFGLFGTKTRTNILLLLTLLEESHASELARYLGTSLSNVQKTLDSLEQIGVVSGAVEGRERRVRLNPRYFAYQELKTLLERLARNNAGLVGLVADVRRRPRRAMKAL